MKINKNYPQCAYNIVLENYDILMFQYQGKITCPKCQTSLHVTMVKSVLVSVILGGLLGYILGAFTALNLTMAIAILFAWLIELLFCTLLVRDGKIL
jgi:hypothetical protein